MAIEFVEKETLGSGWSLEVRRSGVMVGHIRQHPGSGVYRYFRGARNELTPSWEDRDLEEIKKRVSEQP